MKISSVLPFMQNYSNNTKKQHYANLAPLAKDTVSFGKMYKKDFEGIDLIILNKFYKEIPLNNRNFKSNEDLQNWCKEKIENDYLTKDYKAKDELTTKKRKERLNEWFDYLNESNHTNAVKLLIVDGITKNLQNDNQLLPPVLNKKVLTDTINQITEISKTKSDFDLFSNLYIENLENLSSKNSQQNENKTGWIIIPSQENDPDNFEQNTETLKKLSHSNWAAKSDEASLYLSQGDFHIYLENGEPRLYARFKGDKVFEIQGEENNDEIPVNYVDIAQAHTINYPLNKKTHVEFMNGRLKKKKLALYVQNLDKNKTGWVIIPGEPNDRTGSSFAANVEALEGFAHSNWLKSSFVSRMNLLRGDFHIYLENGNPKLGFRLEGNIIKEIQGEKNDDKIPAKYLELLKEQTKNFQITRSEAEKIKKSEKIKKLEEKLDISLDNAAPEEVLKAFNIFDKEDKDGFIILKSYNQPNDELCWDDLNIDENNLFEKVKKIEGDADFRNSKLKNTGNLKEIGGSANFRISQIKNLGNIETIGGNADFRLTKIEDLGKLKTVGGDVYLNNLIKDLGQLEKVGGKLHYSNSKIPKQVFYERGF